MEHIQQDIEGSSIQKWEHDHGIYRFVRGGCEYVRCRDFAAFQRQCEEERERARREYVAQEQYRASFGRMLHENL